jgi:hypothetical protein
LKEKKRGVGVSKRKMLVGGAVPIFNMLHHLQGISRFHLIMCPPYTLKKKSTQGFTIVGMTSIRYEMRD